MDLELRILDLGHIAYREAWKVQQLALEERTAGKAEDTLILAEHPPTITFGLNPEWNVLKVPEEKLKELGIDFAGKTSRGGGAAYLGPGQLIGYVHFDITQYGGVLNFMKLLEEIMIRTARQFGINVERQDAINPTTEKPYRATWYTAEGKNYVLCTKGIGVVGKNDGKFYSHHGFCLNVNKNDSYFGLIDPCGFPVDQVRPISMEEILGRKLEIHEVKLALVRSFEEALNEVVVNASS